MYELLHSFIQQLFPQCQVDLTLVEPFLELRKVNIEAIEEEWEADR